MKAKRTALVTGANRGIGREVANQLARTGMRVILTGRDPTAAAEAAGEVRRWGGDADALEMDVVDPAAVEACARRLRGQGEQVDVLVNNAGVYLGGPLRPRAAPGRCRDRSPAPYCWSAAFTDMRIFSAEEIGQPFFASSAALANAAWSIPGTHPFTSSALDFTSNPPPALGPNSTAQLVSIRCGGCPPCARPWESAIEKQLACAAASSSSGVVALAAPSVRAFQLRPASRNVPLAALVLPFPEIRSPSHCAVARLCMA